MRESSVDRRPGDRDHQDRYQPRDEDADPSEHLVGIEPRSPQQGNPEGREHERRETDVRHDVIG